MTHETHSAHWSGTDGRHRIRCSCGRWTASSYSPSQVEHLFYEHQEQMKEEEE